MDNTHLDTLRVLREVPVAQCLHGLSGPTPEAFNLEGTRTLSLKHYGCSKITSRVVSPETLKTQL
jgi:hypothetical protein